MNNNKFDLYDNFAGPYILDPLTNFNAAKSSYRIEDIKKSFGDLYDCLENKRLLNNNTNQVCDIEDTSNIIMEVLMENV